MSTASKTKLAVRPSKGEKLDIRSKVKLNDGRQMYRFGLGVYESEGQECYNAVMWALEGGYRLIDSAEWYANEAECGKAINDFIKKTGTPREEIYFTSKLMSNSTEEHARQAIKTSLKTSGLDYFDLYLIHGPHPDKTARLASWVAIREARSQGLLRSIGVSNYGNHHIEEIIEYNKANGIGGQSGDAGDALPAVNQIDLHPFMTRDKLVVYNEEKGVVLEAWAPLVRGLRFNHPAVASSAKKHNKSPAQVLIRWGIQRGFVSIPKSVSKHRIEENAQIFDFELTEDEMEVLNGLDEHLVTDWDPSDMA